LHHVIVGPARARLARDALAGARVKGPLDGAVRPLADTPRASEAPPPYQVVDATAPYLAYVDALPSLPASTRVAAFHDRIITAHPELFAADVIGPDLPKSVGYYVGFRVAKTMAARRGADLRALARLE
jgi:hypothetical protein